MSEVPLKGGVACQPPASRSLHTKAPRVSRESLEAVCLPGRGLSHPDVTCPDVTSPHAHSDSLESLASHTDLPHLQQMHSPETLP